jgi:carboxyl-terminal processing protease
MRLLSKDIYMEEAINVLDDLQPRSMSAKDIPVKIKRINWLNHK